MILTVNKILKIAEKMRDCSLGRRNEILHFKRGEMSLFNVQKKLMKHLYQRILELLSGVEVVPRVSTGHCRRME